MGTVRRNCPKRTQSARRCLGGGLWGHLDPITLPMRKDNRLSTDDVLARMAEHNTKALLTAQDKEKAALKMETVAKKMTRRNGAFLSLSRLSPCRGHGEGGGLSLFSCLLSLGSNESVPGGRRERGFFLPLTRLSPCRGHGEGGALSLSFPAYSLLDRPSPSRGDGEREDSFFLLLD